MNEINDIARKRSILFTARVRFSPQTQPVKEAAIDKIIEQNLLLANNQKGLTIREMQEQGMVCFGDGTTTALSRLDMEHSLKRLVKRNRVVAINKKNRVKCYKLSDKVLQEMEEIQHTAETRFNSVVNRLFKNATGHPSDYLAPFLKCLCIIFSQLGENYVRVIKGDIKRDELLGFSSIPSAVEHIGNEFPSIDRTTFNNAVMSFFRENYPDYDAIKWNMAQNYYIAKVLGLDPKGILLSKEIFANAVFYLDTNIIISALESNHKHHRSFKELSQACKRLGIELRVCRISLNELDSVLEHHFQLIEKVADKIPDEMASKVKGTFFKMYHQKRLSNGIVDLDELYGGFKAPENELKKFYKIKIEDGLPFDQVRTKTEVLNFAETLRAKYLEEHGLSKTISAAIHDAQLLFWLQKERQETDSNVWLITLDTSLPGCLPPGANPSSRPLAITLDALLQWISPITVRYEAEDDFAAIFAEAVKYQLVPQESFFDLKDFLVFAEMSVSCKELPAEDVEDCIHYLKTNAPTLDPSEPRDREKLAHEVSRFLADPARKYKQEIQRLESEKEKLRQDYESQIQRITEQLTKLRELNERIILERDQKIKELERTVAESQARQQQEALKRSAWLRLGIVAFIFLLIEAVVVFFAARYGVGMNLFQKVLNSWPFLTLGGAIASGLLYLIMDKKRLRALGLPFTKIIK